MPVISVDTKKKELVGAYKNAGQQWLPGGEPVKVKVHYFIDKELGRANRYGVYDIGADEAWVSVGTDHDTSAFAVQTIRRWWLSMGLAGAGALPASPAMAQSTAKLSLLG